MSLFMLPSHWGCTSQCIPNCWSQAQINGVGCVAKGIRHNKSKPNQICGSLKNEISMPGWAKPSSPARWKQMIRCGDSEWGAAERRRICACWTDCQCTVTFTQHSLFDLVVWLSNIARFPLHLSPYWSIAVSSVWPIRGTNKHQLNE